MLAEAALQSISRRGTVVVGARLLHGSAGTEKRPWYRNPWAWAGAALVALGAVGGGTVAVVGFPKVFSLVTGAYRSAEQWATDRGQQIRSAFHVKPDSLKPAGSIRSSTMSLDEWNRKKLEILAPQYRGRFESFFRAAQAAARSHGSALLIWDSTRTLERQLDLYRRGRVDDQTKVTDTMASLHQFGMAIDVLIAGPNNAPSWSSPGWYTTEVLPLAAQHGLESLYLARGKDKPHIQVPEAEWPAVVASAREQIKDDFPGVA
ncbi:MAG: hypothetical protein ABIE42_09235 [Candidatus Eisenbacteria bacterium]